ncbi:MAG TPA: lamin tail domain-containing protein [Melioribacteraceae bacterium]|nr:lamin tail domain-containing protein [Melioribacteraceae bacterium]
MKKLALFFVLIVSVVLVSCSRDEPYSPTSPTPPPTVNIKINEVFSTGSPDWVEIYNAGTTTVDLSGYKLYDPDGNTDPTKKWTIPAGTTIPAGGYLTFDCDGTGANSNTNFKFSSGGEEVWLENTSGNVIDHITFPALSNDSSYGRSPDGSANLVKFSPATKGTANPTGSNPPVLLPVVINEILSTGSPDWIELYNPNNQPVDVSGYLLYDGSTATNKYAIPAGTIVPANGFLVINCDDGVTGANFKLSSGGEYVTFEKPDGSPIESITFPGLATNTSYGRYPDGSTNWQILSTPTQGTPNQP